MTHNSEDGFTLIELVVTSVVLSTMFLAILGLFGTLRDINARANNLTVATEAAQQQLETFRNLPYGSIAVGTQNTTSQLANYPSLGASRSSSSVVTLVDNRGLKQLDVSLTYFDRGIQKQLQVSTLIALSGINR